MHAIRMNPYTACFKDENPKFSWFRFPSKKKAKVKYRKANKREKSEKK